MNERWEFCPYCGCGFPNYIGATKTHHQYECTVPGCQAFFQVKKGEGNFDKRQGMKLSTDVIYLHDCDSCSKLKAVKLKGWHLLCRDCFKNSKICACECKCT